MNIYKKLQQVRCEVNKKCKKKTGHNKYAGFDYFQLEDFLPTANEEFLKVGLCPVFSILNRKENTLKVIGQPPELYETPYARLRIYDDESNEYIDFETPVAEVKMGAKEEHKRNPIQELGASHTYLKRYLYMNALELSEGDVIDATIGKEDVKKPTILKISQFVAAYSEEERAKIREHYKVKNDEELPRDVVDKYVADRKEKVKQVKEEINKEYNSKPDFNGEENPFY